MLLTSANCPSLKGQLLPNDEIRQFRETLMPAEPPRHAHQIQITSITGHELVVILRQIINNSITAYNICDMSFWSDKTH
jgi:hypothetical protein